MKLRVTGPRLACDAVLGRFSPLEERFWIMHHIARRINYEFEAPLVRDVEITDDAVGYLWLSFDVGDRLDTLPQEMASVEGPVPVGQPRRRLFGERSKWPREIKAAIPVWGRRSFDYDKLADKLLKIMHDQDVKPVIDAPPGREGEWQLTVFAATTSGSEG